MAANSQDGYVPGSISRELADQAHAWWLEAMGASQMDLSGFDASASFNERIAWAKGHGFKLTGILARQSTKMQHSIDSQVRENVVFAAQKKLYPAPEFICADVQTGRKSSRDGLNRMRTILEKSSIDVLLVYKVSRLFRSAHQGFAFVQDFVLENGLRAISVSQGIDTENKETWKMLMVIHGLSDEMLLTAIADHVRSGLSGLFLQGYVTGALTVGYRGVEVPGAPPTKLGRPRRMPAVDPDVAKLIVQAYQAIRNGIPIRRARLQYLEAGGPCDNRSRTGVMSYVAFRRMLSNPRYIGRWAFGIKRNQWSSRKDYTRQVESPDAAVKFVQSEELRIVTDEDFYAVQRILADLKIGPRGPKRKKSPALWDLLTDVFHCAQCRVRFYQYGNHGCGMVCKRMDLCPCKSIIDRKEAIAAVCRTLGDLLNSDTELVAQIVASTQELDSAGDETLIAEGQQLVMHIASRGRKIEDLLELAGEGSDDDRAAIKARIRMAQTERAEFQERLAQNQRRQQHRNEPITPDRVKMLLADFSTLLMNGTSGVPGSDLVYRAAEVIRLLVGGRIHVHAEKRPGRKRSSVYGAFTPQIMQVIRNQLGVTSDPKSQEGTELKVWLRKQPMLDLLAPRVHELMDVEGKSYRDAAKVLQEEGHKFNSGVVWQMYRRYYEMTGLPLPARPYNNGRPRKRRTDTRE